MGALGGIVRTLKDAALAAGAMGQINMQMDFGKVTELKLDSQAKRVDLLLQLKGESDAVSVSLHDYRIKKVGERLTIEIGRITASREWIAILAQNFVVNRPFEIPVAAKYEWLLAMLV